MNIKNSNSLLYNGNLTIKVMNHNKCVKTVRGHNRGYGELFEFLVKCLAHQYSPSLSPNNIRTFAFSNSESEVVPDWDDDSVAGIRNKYETSAITITQSSIKVLSEGDNWRVVFTFVVPGSLINAIDDIAIDTIAIYSDKNYTNLNKPSAVFTFDSDKRITETQISGYNLVILWEMSFDNPAEEQPAENQVQEEVVGE